MISSTLNNAVCSSSNWLQKKGTRDPRAPLPPESAFGKCQDLEGFHLIYILWLHCHSVTSSFQKMTFFWKTFIDDDNESDEDCFCGMVEQGKTFRLPEIFTIADLRHTACRTWTCTEPEFRLCWVKLCNSDNHYITDPLLLCFN